MKKKEIEVYINIDKIDTKVGMLYVDIIRGDEVYSFTYDDKYLLARRKIILDPELEFIKGRQYKKSKSSLWIY